MEIIAKIYTDFSEKFGIPRQGALAPKLTGRIVFEPKYRNPDAVKGLLEFSHLWIIWQFSMSVRQKWTPMVRPPKLGGDTRVGVFATRSPFRPNPIGLTCVVLEDIQFTENGPEIIVSGIDMVNETPIYDIKPYLAYADSHPEAKEAFAGAKNTLEVHNECSAFSELDLDIREKIKEVLRQDPRPGYHDDPERIYGMDFSGYNIKFYVDNSTAHIVKVEPLKNNC